MKHNVYFDGRVQSLALETKDGPATVGVITPGRYSFSTEFQERVVVTTGALKVRLPQEDWQIVAAGESYVAPRQCSFEVEAEADTSYVCYYKSS
jgi:purine/pyrimidine-nucleoside phosphorylase